MAMFNVTYPDGRTAPGAAVDPLDAQFVPVLESGKPVVGLGKLTSAVSAASLGKNRDLPSPDHLRFNASVDPAWWQEYRTRLIDLAVTSVRAQLNEAAAAVCRSLLESILLNRSQSGATEQQYAEAFTDGACGDLEIARLAVKYFLQIEVTTGQGGARQFKQESLDHVATAIKKLAEPYEDASSGVPEEKAIPSIKGAVRGEALLPRVLALKTEILLDLVPAMEAKNLATSGEIQGRAQKAGQVGNLTPVLRALGKGRQHFADSPAAAWLSANALTSAFGALAKIDFGSASDLAKLATLVAGLTAATDRVSFMQAIKAFKGGGREQE